MSRTQAANASRIASRSTETNYKDFTIPSTKLDFFASYKAKAGTDDSESNDIMIAVLPDTRPLTAMILQHVTKHYPSIDLRGHAKVSPGTLALYFHYVAYAYIFFSDYSVSGSPSRYATEIMNDNNTKDFMLKLLNYPVPEFIQTWAANLSYSTLNENNSIFAVLSASGYSHRHDFGRHFPISFFSNMHDHICKHTPKDTTPLNYFLNSTIYSAKLRKGHTSTTTVKPAHLLGIYRYSDTEIHVTNHRLIQLIESVYNPFLSRTYAKRDSFSKINLTTPEFETHHVNPYRMLLSLDPENFTELTVVLDAVKDAFKGIVSCKTDLAGLFTIQSGYGIFQHGYSYYALPTWNATTTLDTLKAEDPIPKPASKFATAIHFIQQHDLIPATATLFPAHGTDAADANLDLVLIDKSKTTASQEPAKSSYESFDVRTHQYPRVIILHPHQKSVESAYLSTLCGLVIESFELDGSAVPHIDPTSHVGDLNNEVLSSAISLTHIRPAVYFETSTTSWWHDFLTRRRVFAPAHKSSTILHDMSRVYVPHLQMNHTTNISPLTAATLPGLTLWKNVSHPFATLSFYGTDTVTLDNSADRINDSVISSPSNISKNRILVWSPYRYVSLVSRKRPQTDASFDQIYMLTNLRTIFGVRSQVTAVSHFMDSIPS